jgi:hypothetical protein
MKQFEFADFVDEFKVPFSAFSQTEGYWTDDGKWVPGETQEVPMSGIVLPLTEDDLKYTEAGSYTVKNKKIYVLEQLKEGQEIKYKDDNYTIQNFKDYSDYADVYIYFMRWREK